MNEQQIREAILDVIDAGCGKHWRQPWLLDAEDESLASDERLRFCDAVIAKLGDNGIVHGMGPIDNTPAANMIPVDAVLSKSYRHTDSEEL